MIKTEKIFGRGEQAHIVSPDFLNLPKLEIPLPDDDTVIESGYIVDVTGHPATIGTTKQWFGIVLEGSHYNDMLKRKKPVGGIEAFFGPMVVDVLNSLTNPGDTPFKVGDPVGVADGKLIHPDDTHIAIGYVVETGANYIRYAIL